MRIRSFIFNLSILALFLIPFALADLNVSGSGSFTTAHNSVLQIPIAVNSTTDVTNVTITITNISDSSQVLAAPITNSSKLSINASQSKDYTISYNIPLYFAPGTRPTTINVSANENSTGTSKSAVKQVNVTINETKALEATSSVSISLPPDAKRSVTFTVKNSGNVNLTNISVTQSSELKDDNGDVITLTITSNKPTTLLKPGETIDFNATADVSVDQALKSYSTSLVINSAEGASTSVSLGVNVIQTFCDSGVIGNFFDLDINEPDSGDDFYPQVIIPVDVTVDNRNDDDRDVVITADLFDATDDEFLDEEVEVTGSVDSNSNDDFSLELVVPTDVKDTHDYRLYVKVFEDGEEEKQCRERNVAIDIKKETHSVIVDKVSLPDTVNCGEVVDGSITLINIGKRDEDAKVKVTNPELKISEERTINIDSGDKRTLSIPIKIPEAAAEKNYTLSIQTLFNLVSSTYEQSKTKTIGLAVQGNCGAAEANTVISLEVLSQPYINERFGIKVQVFNIGKEKAAYKITADNYQSWARLDLIEPVTLTIEPGRSDSAIAYLTPTTELQGDRRITIKAISGDKTIEESATVNVKEKLKASTLYGRVTERLSNLSGFDLATVNIVLIVAIILIAVWIMRVRRSY